MGIAPHMENPAKFLQLIFLLNFIHQRNLCMVSMGLNTVDDFVLDMTMMRIGNPSPVEQTEFQKISMGRC